MEKLLSEVFGEVVERVEIKSTIVHYYTPHQAKQISTYELVYKLKYWAASHKFWILSSLNSCELHDLRVEGVSSQEHIFRKADELSAVIQACQWILDNKEQQ